MKTYFYFRCLCRLITTATDGPKTENNPPDPIESKDTDEAYAKEKEQLTLQIQKLKEDVKEAKVFEYCIVVLTSGMPYPGLSCIRSMAENRRSGKNAFPKFASY